MLTPLESKVVALDAAVARFVQPRMSLHLAFNGARPSALMRELARQYRGQDAGFTLSTSGMGGSHLGLVLLATGIVDTVISAFVGEAYPAPRPSRFIRDAVRSGRLRIEEWSMLTLTLRLKASALGLDFIPTRSLLGTSFDDGVRTRHAMVDGHDVLLVPALKPDLTLLHGVIADPSGNTVLAPPFGENVTAAYAARRGCLVTVERIVSHDEFRRYTTQPVVSGAVVRSVSEVPFGSHPGGIFAPAVAEAADYADDYEFMLGATEATRLSPAERDSWIEQWFAVDPATYAERLGEARLALLQAMALPGGDSVLRGIAEQPAEPSAEEHVISHAARLLRQAVQEERHGLVIGGVGLASLSTWLAAAGDKSFPLLASEVGAIGYVPQPGNPFLFSFDNLRGTGMFSDIEGVLGTLVNADGQRALGVLAAGQIDGTGAINTSYAANGDWLTGSGGGNDIASGARDIMVAVLHRPGRLVEKVSYTTSPGTRVRWIVTDWAVFERPAGATSFRLRRVRVLPGENTSEAIARVAGATPWPCEPSRQVEVMESPTLAELEFLRAHDPQRFFLG